MQRRPWTEITCEIVERCELAAKINQNVTWNAKGADALGKVIKEMATLLDNEVERREVADSAVGDG